jgi:hypothetical protein
MLRADYRTYLTDNPITFQKDLTTTIIRLFGEHGLSVRFASSTKSVFREWVGLAGIWSLRIPDRRGQVSAEENPSRLSHIKLGGLLSWSIMACRPVADFGPMDDQLRAMFDALGWDREIHADAEFIQRFPNEVCATAIGTGLFLAYQAGRDGRVIYEPTRTPRTYHYDRNLAMFMREGRIGPESLYMIFKTMDLFGHEAKVLSLTG